MGVRSRDGPSSAVCYGEERDPEEEKTEMKLRRKKIHPQSTIQKDG